MKWNACVHRLDLVLYSHQKKKLENGVRTHVNSKRKIPSTGDSEQGRTHNAASRRTARPTRYQLSYSGPNRWYDSPRKMWNDSWGPLVLLLTTEAVGIKKPQEQTGEYSTGLTVIPSAREVLPILPLVIDSGVPSPGNPVVGRQCPGPLGFVEQDGLVQHVVVIVLGVHLCKTTQGGITCNLEDITYLAMNVS